VLAGIFAIPFIPLIVANHLFFPFITGKNFTFRILIEIITAAWLALALVHPAYRPRRSWIWGSVAVFVLIIGLADLFGANALKSVWSNFERMEGWVTLAHLLAYVTVLYGTLTTEKLWQRLIYTSIGVSVLTGFYGLLQLAGFITINQGGVRLDATFGNATYLAVYMLFHLFLTALMWEKSWREHSQRMWLSILYGGIMLLQAVVLFFTATRGSILGTLGGAFLSALILVVLARNSKNAWRASVGVVTGVLVLVGLFFAFKNTALVQKVEPLQRLASISLTETTVSSRFLNYGMAWQGVKEHPLLGWGQENYNLVFNKYYDPRMYAQEPWFDRVHNIVFDWLVAGGILGFAAYVSMFLTALFGLWKSGAFTIPERSILTGLLAAYTFHNLFVFDNITSYIMFMLVLGYIAFRVAQVKNAAPIMSAYVPHKALPVVALFAVFGLWGVAWGVNSKAYAANKALIRALTPGNDIQLNINGFKDALSYNSAVGNQEIREQLIQGSARLASSALPPETKGSLFELAHTEMEKQVAAAPEDARFPLFLSILNDTYGRYDEGKKYIDEAHELSPNKQAIIFQQATNARLRNDDQAALAYLKEAFELEPAFDDARVQYAAELIRQGDAQTASSIAEPVIAKGVVDQRLIAAYVAQNDYGNVAKIWAGKVAAQPEDVQARFALAASYFAAGSKDKAVEVLETTARDIPDAAGQAAQLIEQIKNGTATLSQ